MDTTKPDTLSNTEPQPQPQTEQPKQPTAEEMRAKVFEMQQAAWHKMADASRLNLARNRGLATKDGKPTALAITKYEEHTKTDDKPGTILKAEELITVDALRALVPLEGDTIRYAKTKDGLPRIAMRGVFIPFPKPHGRKRPHMTKHQQAIKSLAIQLFKPAFIEHGKALEAKAKEAGEQFNGVPEADIPKLGAKASKQAAIEVNQKLRKQRRRLRNMRTLSRLINGGTLPGNTNTVAFMQADGVRRANKAVKAS